MAAQRDQCQLRRPEDSENCAMLKPVRQAARRLAMSATAIAIACMSSAIGRPAYSSSAKMKAVDVLTPLTSMPAMTSGRTSPMTTRAATTIRAARIAVKSWADSFETCMMSSAKPTAVTMPR